MALIKSLLRITLGVIIAIPLLLYPLLYFAQDKLIFMPRKMDKNILNWIREEYPNAEVQITTPDNIRLHGWYIKNTAQKKAPLIIYFGGNAEEVSGQLMALEPLLNTWSLLLVNYRGYGLSEGSPSEKHLFNDAVLLYDTFGADSDKIVAFGRSLGTGVAVYLAAQRPLKGVILVSPYDSIRHLAQKNYPYVPVSYLLKHHFDSLALAPSIKTPMLALIAAKDRIIPPSHSFALIEAWGGVTQQQIISGTNHNNITMGTGYWKYISAFLHQLTKIPPT